MTRGAGGPSVGLLALFASFASLLSAGANARADDVPAPRVSVNLTACDASLASEVERIAGVELRAVVVSSADARDPVTRAVVACHDGVADLWVSDPATAKLVGRTVSLGAMSPSARARLLALAVAELVSASWEEVESNPAPKVAAATPAAPEARASVRASLRAVERVGGGGTPREVDAPHGVALDAAAEARVFFSGSTPVFGAAMRATMRLASPLTLRLDAGADFGDVGRLTGHVTVLTQQGSVSLGWAFEVALLWAGFRVGFARLEGQPIENVIGHVESGVWAGPQAGVDFVFWRRSLVHMMVGVSAGAALDGVRGDVQGDPSVLVLGGWAALTLGVGISKP